MNKTDLIMQIAKTVDLSKADAGKALDAMIDAIIKAANDGQKVTLIGFGTFMVTERKARDGRNPRNGETIKIPAARVPKFIPGKAFKGSIK
jgi:DNA-binding protein HU-beta